jgi:hypothetical protein
MRCCIWGGRVAGLLKDAMLGLTCCWSRALFSQLKGRLRAPCPMITCYTFMLGIFNKITETFWRDCWQGEHGTRPPPVPLRSLGHLRNPGVGAEPFDDAAYVPGRIACHPVSFRSLSRNTRPRRAHLAVRAADTDDAGPQTNRSITQCQGYRRPYRR